MSAAALNLTICQGKTFTKPIRWGSGRKLYRTITAATKAAPCVLTSVAHGIPNGWVFRISNVLGMVDLNSENRTVNDGFYTATVNTTDAIELNDVNATGFKPYVSGGVIEYNEPIALTGATARLQIRKTIASPDVLLELSTATGGITIDPVAFTITLNITATATAALLWSEGVYELEITQGAVVSSIAKGAVKVVREVTR